MTAADLQATLQALGHEVIGTVNSGAAAVNAARDSSPDVILMDVRLRDAIDGIAAAVNQKNSDVPIVSHHGEFKRRNIASGERRGGLRLCLEAIAKKDLNATILVALKQHRYRVSCFPNKHGSEPCWKA